MTFADGYNPPNSTSPESAVGSSRHIYREEFTAFGLFAVTAVLIVASRWISPNLGSWNQARAILVLSTFVMVVGFGQQMVILIGGLDLSVAAVMTLGAILMFSYVGASPLALLWGLPVVLLVTGAIGGVNGLCVSLLGVPPFIMTLAMSIIVASTVLGMTGGAPGGEASLLLIRLFDSDWFGAPPIVYLMACFSFLAWSLQRRTVFGRMVYAIGTSPAAAYIAGLPVKRVTISCYIISGCAAGLAGILMVGFSQGATVTSGDAVLIPSIACVVVGGTSIVGGQGNYLGAVGGALLLTTASTMITALGISEGWRILIYGAVILTALLILRDEFRTWVAQQQAALTSLLPVRGQDHPGAQN
jgi:ribose transport system permease protein